MRLLELDPDLGVDLDPQAFAAASAHLAANVLGIDWTRARGPWGPDEPAGHLGLLISEGVLLREVRLMSTTAAEVLGPGDLLRPWDVDGEYVFPVPGEVRWTVLAPCAMAVLDAAFSTVPRTGPTSWRA